MCICFIFASTELDEGVDFQVIIANNRDEYYARPTKPAHFWNAHCLSGLDDEPSKKGGTWFGISTSGKIGALLNILDPTETNLRRGRGYLVSNYLSGDSSAEEYSYDLSKDGEDYNKFNLVLLEKKQTWQIVHTSNVEQEQPCILKQGIMAIGNSPYDKPWKKVEHGKTKFADIIKEYNSIKKKEALKEKLVELLSDRKSHWPDPQLMSQLKDENHIDFGKALSSNFVDLSKVSKYGTRTHTILLIDKSGFGEYTEITMDTTNRKWNTTCTPFHLK